VLIGKINTFGMVSLHEEEEEPNGRLKEPMRHRGPSLIRTPKGTSHW